MLEVTLTLRETATSYAWAAHTTIVLSLSAKTCPLYVALIIVSLYVFIGSNCIGADMFVYYLRQGQSNFVVAQKCYLAT